MGGGRAWHQGCEDGAVDGQVVRYRIVLHCLGKCKIEFSLGF